MLRHERKGYKYAPVAAPSLSQPAEYTQITSDHAMHFVILPTGS